MGEIPMNTTGSFASRHRRVSFAAHALGRVFDTTAQLQLRQCCSPPDHPLPRSWLDFGSTPRRAVLRVDAARCRSRSSESHGMTPTILAFLRFELQSEDEGAQWRWS